MIELQKRFSLALLCLLALEVAAAKGATNGPPTLIHATNLTSASNTNNLTIETNLIDTNATKPLISTNAAKLNVVSHPDETNTNNATGIRASNRKSAPARFFELVKNAFGVGNVVHLFNGKDIDNFYTWLSDSGTYVDPDGVFSVEDGAIRISGQHQGFLATKGQFGDYKLVAEFRWGDQTWYKREETPKNSGLFINAVGLDAIDMRAIECQMMDSKPGAKEGTGDIVLHGGAKLTVGTNTQSRKWATFTRENARELDSSAETWNKMEVLCEGDRVRVTVNGRVALDGRRANPHFGKILLQSNGAEIFFRRLDLYPLDTNSVSIFKGKDDDAK